MSDIGHNGGPPLLRGGDGWVAIHRSMRDHWIVGFGQPVKPLDPDKGALSRAEAWIDLIMECRYDAGTVNNGGHKMKLEPGQLVGAVSWLATRWNWTPKTVRVFLDKLEEDGMIDRAHPGVKEGDQRGKQSSVISVCNYSQYQITSSEEGQAKGQAEGKQGASKGQARGNNNKDNKGTKEQRNKEDNPSDLPPSGGDDVPKTIKLRDVAREAFAEWQEFAKIHGLPVPRDVSFETFADKIALRIQEHADAPTREAMLRVWKLALSCVAKSKHCRGENDRGWRADIEFMCRREKFAKLISGSYGNGAAPLDDRWRIAVPWATPPPTDHAPAKSRDGAFRQAIEEWAQEGDAND